MRFAAGLLVALVAAAASSPAQARKCMASELTIPPSQIDGLLGEADFDRRLDLLLDVLEYWDSYCPTAKENAGPEAVDQLTRLLVLFEARFATVGMLADVGPNLPRAKPAVDAAMADTIEASYRFLAEADPEAPLDREAARGLMPGPAYNVFHALECVTEKIDSGRISDSFCFSGLRAKEPK
jgi:hypothetical protein